MPAAPSNVTADFLTLSEAARIAGRSYSWARSRALLDGQLDVRRFAPGGVIHVTATSLCRLIELERKQNAKPARPASSARRTHLHLVIDNSDRQPNSSI